MRKFLIGLVILIIILFGLSKCNLLRPYDEQMRVNKQVDDLVNSWASSHSSVEPDQPREGDSRPEGVLEEVVLVDQHYSTAGVKGSAWLKAIGAKTLKGDIKNAQLEIVSDSPVGVYLAVFEGGRLKESLFGTRTRFIGQSWAGNCTRQLTPKTLTQKMAVALESFPVTQGTDGCQTGMETLNLEQYINDDGLLIGFLPLNPASHVKVTLLHEGSLAVTPY